MSNRTKRDAKLGVGIGTASRRLLRKLVFEAMCVAGKNACFHCSQSMALDDYTIEHTKGWTDYEGFMRTDDIAYSHHRCNSADGLRKRPVTKYSPKNLPRPTDVVSTLRTLTA